MDIVSLIYPDGLVVAILVAAVLFAVIRVTRGRRKRIQKSQEVAPSSSPAPEEEAGSPLDGPIVISAELSKFTQLSAGEIASLNVVGVNFDPKGFLLISLRPGAPRISAPPGAALSPTPAQRFACTFAGCGQKFPTLQEGAKHEEANLYHVVQPIPAV